jgi:flavin-dependent dehydrogenase
MVVGASGPGLLAAYELASQGVPVHVYEQAERLEPAARTLIVTPDINRALGFVPDAAIRHRVDAFELRSNGTLANVTLEQPDLIVERAALIRLLADRALQAGARICFDRQFCGFVPDLGTTWAIMRSRSNGRIERVAVRHVIGADGAQSAVARALRGPRPHLVTNLQARVALQPGANPYVSQVWFRPDDTRYFYWLIPESEQCAVVGLAHDGGREARTLLDAFLRSQNLTPSGYEAARIPMYGPSQAPSARVGHADVFLVGDAAGQVKVTTVGGTVTGLRGARAAARAIMQRSTYRSELRDLNRELTLHWMLRWVLNRFREEEYGALLRSLNARVHALLATRNRDRLDGAFWSLALGQPRLVLLAARAAATGS